MQARVRKTLRSKPVLRLALLIGVADDGLSPFQNVIIDRVEQGDESRAGATESPKLGFSRAYSLSLSPQLIYTRSNLLPALVSSKIYRQLEFLAVGSWWLFSDNDKEKRIDIEDGQPGEQHSSGNLRRIPGGREDVFADKDIDRRSMMPLMRFLKLAADPEAHTSIIEEWGPKPFTDFLETQFKISTRLQEPLFALSLSPNSPADTLTSYALPRIHRHLTSIGMFGPGFGAVIPKWGGLAEISQVACRAGAVGGGVYVLKKGFEEDGRSDRQASGDGEIHLDHETRLLTLSLEGNEAVNTHWLVGSQWKLPSRFQDKIEDQTPPESVSRSITIVSGSLSQLFPPPADGAPPPAGAITVFPTRTLRENFEGGMHPTLGSDPPPVYLTVHSSETGECPTGQCKSKPKSLLLLHSLHDDTKL